MDQTRRKDLLADASRHVEREGSTYHRQRHAKRRRNPRHFCFSIKAGAEMISGMGRTPGHDNERQIVRSGKRHVGAHVVTAIWRWNVDRVHGEPSSEQTSTQAGWGCRRAVKEAFVRYRVTLYPQTAQSKHETEIARKISMRWEREEDKRWKHSRADQSRWVSLEGEPGAGRQWQCLGRT